MHGGFLNSNIDLLDIFSHQRHVDPLRNNICILTQLFIFFFKLYKIIEAEWKKKWRRTNYYTNPRNVACATLNPGLINRVQIFMQIYVFKTY